MSRRMEKFKRQGDFLVRGVVGGASVSDEVIKKAEEQAVSIVYPSNSIFTAVVSV